MTSVIDISISFIMQMVRYLSSVGTDIEAFLENTGIMASYDISPDERISIRQFYDIQEKALNVTQDPHFGLHLGEYTVPGSWSILGYLLMNCSTLSEAIERLCRYHEVLGNAIQIKTSTGKTQTMLLFKIRMPDSKNIRHCYDAATSSVVCMMKSITGAPVPLKKVTMEHDGTDDILEYERIFGCPVRFGQTSTALVFDTEILDTPVVMHNPGLLKVFEAHANDIRATLNSKQFYTKKVNYLIMEHLPSGTPAIGNIATELFVSVRTLQQKLAEEGTSFRHLLESVRKELAINFLKDRDYSIDDITWMTGFSEPSVFRKSFKKWTGISPGEYRNQLTH